MRKKNSQKKQVIDRIGRGFSLVFNRALMYKTNHPTTVQSIGEFYRLLCVELKKESPIAILVHRDALFVDDEAVDPKINVSKIMANFKESGVESISFDDKLTLGDMNLLLDVLTDVKRFPTARSMKQALKNQGIHSLSINHVVYRKVTEEEDVVAKKDAEHSTEVNRLLIEKLIESASFVGHEGLINEIFGVESGGNTAGFVDGVGQGLMRLDGEVGQRLSGLDDRSVEKLLKGFQRLKKELETRLVAKDQGEGAGFLERGLLDKTHSVADGVILDLIRREYGKGIISIERLAQIIQRIVPDSEDLQRLLPNIEGVLLKEGMHLTEFVQLSEMLQGHEAQREVMEAITEGAEAIGLQGKDLLNEITGDPRSAAELIYLASEVRKGSGDQGALTEILVEYIERIGGKMAMDSISVEAGEGESHLQGVVSQLERDIVHNLRGKGIPSEVMDSVVDKLSGRLEGCLKKLESDWDLHTSASAGEGRGDATNVLSYFEETIDSMEDLQFVLQKARESVQELREKDGDGDGSGSIPIEDKPLGVAMDPILPKGVLGKKNTFYFVEKELHRAYRYKTHFTLAMFEVLSAKVSSPVEKGSIKTADIVAASLDTLRDIIRDTDTLGLTGAKRFVVLMPMTDDHDARIALRRILKELQMAAICVGEIGIDVTFAGAVMSYDMEESPEIRRFMKAAGNALEEMAHRVRNIQTLL